MRIRTFVAGLALLPLAGLTAGFGPGNDCEDAGKVGAQTAKVCTLDTYLACPGGDEAKAHFNQVHGDVTLTTDAPSRSVQAGAGCGHLVQPLVTDGWPVDQDLVVRGAFQGNLRSIGVELHYLGMGDGQAQAYSEEMSVEYTLLVDGTAARSGTATVIPEVSSTGASVAMRFRIANLGLVLEAGKGTTERTITLRTGYPHTDDCQDVGDGGGCMLEGAYIPVWGTSEVPARITFNG